MEWYQQYGAVYRTGGCFGVRTFIYLCAMALTFMSARHFVRRWPKGVAVHFSFVWIPIHKDKRYPFHRRRSHGTRHSYCWWYANGLCVANVLCLIEAPGSVHQRQRKILGPAFAASQLRLFLNVFQTSALKVWRYTGFHDISSFERSSL